MMDIRANRIYHHTAVNDRTAYASIAATYLEGVHPFSMRTHRLQDPCGDVHQGAKELSEQHQRQTFVPYPEVPQAVSPAAPPCQGRSRGK